jgi:hypothetical protein
MSLNYNLGRIAQFKDNFDLAYQEYNGMGGTYTDVKADLKQLIFASMMISLNEITYKNVAEWYARLIVAEEMNNLNIWEKWEGNELVKVPVEPKLLTQYIGLSTNSTVRSRSEWVKVMLRNNKDTKYNVSTLTSKLRKLEVQFEEKVYL